MASRYRFVRVAVLGGASDSCLFVLSAANLEVKVILWNGIRARAVLDLGLGEPIIVRIVYCPRRTIVWAIRKLSLKLP